MTLAIVIDKSTNECEEFFQVNPSILFERISKKNCIPVKFRDEWYILQYMPLLYVGKHSFNHRKEGSDDWISVRFLCALRKSLRVIRIIEA